MQDNQSYSNNNNDNSLSKYKICAGKGCNNVGNNRLKILFINKFGWFCDCCKEDFTKLRLIQESEGNRNLNG
jgi:hypothetical protein